MGRAIVIALAAGLGVGSAGQAAQPISRSMAECHAILHVAADIAEGKRAATDAVKMSDVADRFAVASVAQARAEGRPEAEAYVSDIVIEVSPKWQARRSNLLKMRDTLDWISYFDALGRDRSIIE